MVLRYKTGTFGLEWNTPVVLSDIVSVLGLDDELSGILSVGQNWNGFGFHHLRLAYDTHTNTLAFEGAAYLKPATDESSASHTLNSRAVVGKTQTSLECSWQTRNGETFSVLELLDTLAIPMDTVDDIIKHATSIQSFRMRFSFKPHPSIFITAESVDEQQVIVSLGKPGTSWQVAMGVTFTDSDVSLADLPGSDGLNLAALGDIAFGLQYLFFANASMDTVMLPNPTVDNGFGPISLERGLTIGIVLDLNHNSDIRVARDLVGNDALYAQLSWLGNAIEINAKIPGTLSIPTGDETNFEISQASLKIHLESRNMSVGFQGTLAFELFNEMRTLTPELVLSTRMLALNAKVENGNLIGDVSGLSQTFEAIERIPVLPGIVLHTEEYHLQLGAYFTPPAFVFGIMGDFHIGEANGPYQGEYALVLHMLPGVVKPAYIALEIDTFSLWAALEARFAIQRSLDDVGGVVEDLATLATVEPANDAISFSREAIDFIRDQYDTLRDWLEEITLTDVSLYWAADNIILPDGRPVDRGFGFEGTLNVLGLDAYAKFEFSPGVETGRPSIFGYAECQPLSLAGLVKVTGQGQGKLLTTGGWSPTQQLMDAGNNAKTPNLTIQNHTYQIPPGGPVLKLNHRRVHSPQLAASLTSLP